MRLVNNLAKMADYSELEESFRVEKLWRSNSPISDLSLGSLARTKACYLKVLNKVVSLLEIETPFLTAHVIDHARLRFFTGQA